MEENKYTIDYNKPEHPLPQEIQTMERDETICQFCGVSYLIHNEIKRLEEKMMEMEEKMKFYQGSVDREKELKIQMRNMEEENEGLKKSLNDKEERISLILSDVKLKNELLQNQKETNKNLENLLKNSKETNTLLSNKLTKMDKLLPALALVIKDQRNSLESTRSCVRKERDFVMDCVAVLSKSVAKTVSAHEKVTDELKTQIHKVNTDNSTLQEQVIKAEKLFESSKSELTVLEDTKTQLNNTKTTCRNLEEKLRHQDESITQITQRNRLLENDLAQCQEKIKSKSKEADDLRSQLQKRDELSRQDNMKTEQDLKRKDTEILNLQLKCKTLEKQLQEISSMENEVKQRASSSHQEVKALRISLQQAKDEMEGYKMERDKMITAHHNRIEQLRESFKRKMEEADAWPAKLEDKLREQESRLKKEKDILWQELNESFQKELESLEVKHETETKQYTSEAKALQEKLKSEINELSRKSREETRKLERLLAEEKEKTLQAKQSNEHIIQNMESQVSDLQHRLSQRSSASAEDITELKKKLKLSQETLHDAERAMNEMEARQKTAQDEIAFLQETVGRECEERFDLMASLSDARAQLIQLQRSSGPSLSRALGSSGSLGSPKSLTADSSSDSAKRLGTNCSVGLNGVNYRPGSRSQDAVRSSRDVSTVDDERKRIAAAMGRKDSKTSLGSSFTS